MVVILDYLDYCTACCKTGEHSISCNRKYTGAPVIQTKVNLSGLDLEPTINSSSNNDVCSMDEGCLSCGS